MHSNPIKPQHSSATTFIQRLLAMLTIIGLLTAILIGKLVYLQFFQHERYTTLSDNNHISIYPIRPTRGLIYDRNGVLIAENIPTYNLEVIPERVDDLSQTIRQLQELFVITDEDIDRFYRATRQRRIFEGVPLRSNLTEEEITQFAIEQYRFPGVLVRASLIRHYPFASHLTHVVGYVGRINEQELQIVDPINYSATNYIGKLGIEKYFEDRLHGAVGYQSVETDASGRTIRVLEYTAPTPGEDIYLTIDHELQQVAEVAIGDRRGSVVAIIPKTGEVLALVSQPSYDPNLFVQGIPHTIYQELLQSPDRPLYNRSIRGQYPMASTIKPFLGLRALSDNIISPDYRISDPGWFKLPNSSYTYRDWKKRGHGWVNAQRAVTVSCDTYFYNLANLMGIKTLSDTLFDFGFGNLSGIEMQEELPGLIPTPEWKRGHFGKPWYPGETVISGIGQGYILTTPLQLAVGAATLANEGTRTQPRLLLKSIDAEGEVKYAPTHIAERLHYTPEAWEIIFQAMLDVVHGNEGTGRRFGREIEYKMAAKTGTAQVFSAQKHEHLDKKNLPPHLQDHSLFIAFAPAENPQIAVAVVVEHSKLAGAVARTVIDHYLLEQKQLLDENPWLQLTGSDHRDFE